jgi:hypothetical protein
MAEKKKRKPNRTKTLIRQVERKKQTIKNIRQRQQEDRKWRRIGRDAGMIIGGLDRIINGGGFE